MKRLVSQLDFRVIEPLETFRVGALSIKSLVILILVLVPITHTTTTYSYWYQPLIIEPLGAFRVGALSRKAVVRPNANTSTKYGY